MQKYILSSVLGVILWSCSSPATNWDEESYNIVESRASTNSDSDNDYIPDNIEKLIGSDPYNSDQNNNGTLDGVETQGDFGDLFFDKQWYIRSHGSITNSSGVASISGYDLGLLPIYQKYMGYNYGNNIIIQIVDTAVYARHEDLAMNIDISRSYDGLTAGRMPIPSINNSHGTKVAGVIGARAFNGVGVRGVIPFAKLAVSNWLETSSLNILDKIWYSGQGSNEIAVSNNSWGFDFSSNTLPEEYMQQATTLRNGKGRVFVFPSGNTRNVNGNANLDYLLNNRFAITVASINYNNVHSSFSTKGSNVLVSAYSGEDISTTPTIATTTIPKESHNSGTRPTTWSHDNKRNYTYDFDGTSTAAPMVSGAIGLVLEACPNLTWRDIRYILAKTSKRIDRYNDSWVRNGAGIYHSIDYGYGLIQPRTMIELCQNDYEELPSQRSFQKTIYPRTKLPDDHTKTTYSLDIERSLAVEWVELTIDSDHTYASDLEIYLQSPNGTKTQL
ncbi:MAG: S8 family serine peptidase, partial [Campylobacterota bacterium]|nr:S8 family serine peptidase [Campylobacterota bacterium]